jgi:hypothetical protein
MSKIAARGQHSARRVPLRTGSGDPIAVTGLPAIG